MLIVLIILKVVYIFITLITFDIVNMIMMFSSED